MTLPDHIRTALPENFCSQQWLPNGLVGDYANVVAGLLLMRGVIDRETLTHHRTYTEHLVERCTHFGKPIAPETLRLLVTEENGGKQLDSLALTLRMEAEKDPLNIPDIQNLCIRQMQILFGEAEGRQRIEQMTM